MIFVKESAASCRFKPDLQQFPRKFFPIWFSRKKLDRKIADDEIYWIRLNNAENLIFLDLY